MAAPWHGKSGCATFKSAEVVHLTSWELSFTDNAATAATAGDDWKYNLSGIQDFSVSARCLSQLGWDTISTLGANAVLKLSIGGASEPYYQGNAIATAITETIPADGIGTIDYTFAGSANSGLTYNATGGVSPSGTSDPVQGKRLKVVLDSTEFAMPREWTVNLTCDAAEAAYAHATNNYMLRLPGIKSATATVTTVASENIIAKVGQAYQLDLYRTQTADDGYYSGKVVLTSVPLTVDVGGIVMAVYTFAFTGTVELKTT